MSAKHATKAQVLTYASALSAIDPEPLQSIVDATALMISLEAWGSKAFDAHKNLAAHFGSKALSSGTGGGASGPVTSRSIGPLSVSYAAPVMSAGDVVQGASRYGDIYLMLRETVVVPPLTAGGLCL